MSLTGKWSDRGILLWQQSFSLRSLKYWVQKWLPTASFLLRRNWLSNFFFRLVPAGKLFSCLFPVHKGHLFDTIRGKRFDICVKWNKRGSPHALLIILQCEKVPPNFAFQGARVFLHLQDWRKQAKILARGQVRNNACHYSKTICQWSL